MSGLSFTSVSAMLVMLPNVSSSTNATSSHLFLFAQGAESIINAKLARTYALPFTCVAPTGSVLHTIATDLACYRFLALRVFTSERSNDSPWPARFKESMELLDQVVSGAIPLLDCSGALIPASVGQTQVWSNTMTYRPTMTEDDEWFQVVDGNKIWDVEDARREFVGPE